MSFDDWLCKRLDELAIDGEVYGEYVHGIVSDADVDLDERCTTAVDILRAVVEDDSCLNGMAEEIKRKWTEEQENIAKKQAQSLEEEKARLELQKQKELQLVHENELKEAEKAQARQHMTRDELLQREKILNEYGASDSSYMDEDGNVILRESKKSAEESGPVNTNKSQAQQHQQNLRDKMKKEHDHKVKREKELLEADRLRKEKAKRLTFSSGLMQRPKQQPTFVLLLRDALATVGISYLTPEHIRLAKSSVVLNDEFDENHAFLCIPFWRALHDVCMVILADFDIDAQALAVQSQALFDEPDGFDVSIEVTRYYLYEWGFVCREFYTNANPLTMPGPILLAALVYLFGVSDFFSRQALTIIQLQLNNNRVLLPPYSQEANIDENEVEQIFQHAIKLQSTPDMEFRDVIDSIHAAFGKLKYQLRARGHAHNTYLERIQAVQYKNLGSSSVLMNKESITEEILSPYCLWLLQNPNNLSLHLQALDRRQSNFNDEKQFYQWAITAIQRGLKSIPRPCHDQVPTLEFSQVIQIATQTNEWFKSLLPTLKTTSLHWKAISGKEKAKYKDKMDNASLRISSELPTLDLLFTRIKLHPPKLSTLSLSPRPNPSSPNIQRHILQEEIERLIGLFEHKLHIRLI
ncbi:hypothetical protein THRCLA_03834 [Thraustotheca clavata]|uniref:CCDC43 PWI-like domain-containing protein n=1 Tax=Thraustotheca clavata TaxID=74557 RepID=A0A1W0A0S6_9STRA|nr:hypothetical protein THRCLA_03834 [Thraustotheca clavata]